MPFTEDQNARIIAAVEKVAGRNLACWICRNETWQLVDGVINQPLHDINDPFSSLRPSGPALPSIAVICTRCGNTVYLNLFTLGLGDLVSGTGKGA